jgi:hypothetical protein
MSKLSDQLNQIHSLDKAFEAEDDMILRHIDDVIARADDRRRVMHARLTTVAGMMGISPARQPPQVPEQIKQDPFQIPRAAMPLRPLMPSEQNASVMFDAFNEPRKVAGGR